MKKVLTAIALVGVGAFVGITTWYVMNLMKHEYAGEDEELYNIIHGEKY